MRALRLIAATVLAARAARACDHDHQQHHNHRHHLVEDLDLGLHDAGDADFATDVAGLRDEHGDPPSPLLREARGLRRHKKNKKKLRRTKAPPCKTIDLSQQDEALMEAAAAARKQARNGIRQGIIAENATSNAYDPIKVYWNVMKAGETARLGAFNRSNIDLVIAGLNQIYNSTPFSFKLAGSTQTTNAQWFNCTDAVETAYKVKLRKEGADVLNVYQCDFLGAQGFTGEGYYPVGVQYSTYSYLDGVSVFNPFVRSGHSLNSLTTTLAHEVGHWLGLKHTFSKNNSCDGDADSIADTPSHPSASLYMPGASTCFADGTEIPDTCSDNATGVAPGLDPVFNHMNYGYTHCLMEYGYFSPGQVEWMVDMFEEFRWKKATCRASTIGCALNSNCCSRVCLKGKCSCRAKGLACTSNVNCCSGTCSNRKCL